MSTGLKNKGVDMIYVVGIGPGEEELRTIKASRIIDEAEIIIGGKRNLETIKNCKAKRYYISADLEKMKTFILENLEKKILVLASGDPSLYGIGDYILRELSSHTEIEIISGISSIQYAFSAFKINMNNVYITSSHAREVDFDFLFAHDKFAMLTDQKIGPREVAEKIIE